MKIKKILGYYGLILFAINALALFLTFSLVSNVLTDTKLLNIMNEFIANRKNLNFILYQKYGRPRHQDQGQYSNGHSNGRQVLHSKQVRRDELL